MAAAKKLNHYRCSVLFCQFFRSLFTFTTDHSLCSYAWLCCVESFRRLKVNRKWPILTWNVNGSNFDGALLLSAGAGNDENLIGYRAFAPLFNDMNEFIEICLKFE